MNDIPGKDVLVIGGGIVGQSCAFQLRKAGYEVTVVERGDPAASTAIGGCAILATTHVAPVALPGSLSMASGAVDGPGPLVIRSRYIRELLEFLVPFYAASQPDASEDISRVLKQLNDRAIDAFRGMLAGTQALDLIEKKGWLYVYKSKATLDKAMLELGYRERRGNIIQFLSGDEAREMEPALSDSITHAVFLPEAAHIANPVEFMRSLARQNADAGVNMVRDEILSLANVDGRVIAKSAQREYKASQVVLAAGPWSANLARDVGVRFPHAPEAGYSVTYPDSPFTLRLPISSGDYKCVINSMEAGLRLTTGADLTNVDAEEDFSQAERLRAAAADLFKGGVNGDGSAWRGMRSLSPDSLPVIGRAPNTENLVLAYGHGHLGITLAALTGELVVKMLADPSAPGDFPQLGAERYAAYY